MGLRCHEKISQHTYMWYHLISPPPSTNARHEENIVGLTTDRHDPRLTHGVDETPVEQNEVYLVLSEEERKKGFVRPYRDKYVHVTCGGETTMGRALSETYARNPKFYGATYCVHCRMHRPVNEFNWSVDDEVVGS